MNWDNRCGAPSALNQLLASDEQLRNGIISAAQRSGLLRTDGSKLTDEQLLDLLKNVGDLAKRAGDLLKGEA